MISGMPQLEKRWRVVCDTNVFVAAFLSANPRSPNRELIQRWLRSEFVLLRSRQLTLEIVNKLVEKRISPLKILRLITNLTFLAESIKLESTDVHPVVTQDPDDDYIIACAVKGNAQYIITYDPHILNLGPTYFDIKITEPLPFLLELRKFFA